MSLDILHMNEELIVGCESIELDLRVIPERVLPLGFHVTLSGFDDIADGKELDRTGLLNVDGIVGVEVVVRVVRIV